jgi:hypothetical protein
MTPSEKKLERKSQSIGKNCLLTSISMPSRSLYNMEHIIGRSKPSKWYEKKASLKNISPVAGSGATFDRH